MATMATTTHKQVTPMEILQDRQARKNAGGKGCITGRPVPEIDFFGYKDVQCWAPEDPMDPHCFCFDCRDAFDHDGEIDAELVNKSHNGALYTYRNLIPSLKEYLEKQIITERPFTHDLALPTRSGFSNTTTSGFSTTTPQTHIANLALPMRTNCGGITPW